MDGIEQRLPALAAMRRKHLAQLENNALDPGKDKGGAATTSLANTLRFLAVAEFKLEGDVEGFRRLLGRSVCCRLGLFKRSISGESIPSSYLAMVSYKYLLDALASGDHELAKELASVMGGRKAIEDENDHPFDQALGYAIKSVILDADDKVEKIRRLKDVLRGPYGNDFIGYAEALEAIVSMDSGLFQDALEGLLVGHKRQCRKGGVFKDSEDEILCVWGAGLVGLAKSRGLLVRIEDSLLPAALTA